MLCLSAACSTGGNNQENVPILPDAEDLGEPNHDTVIIGGFDTGQPDHLIIGHDKWSKDDDDFTPDVEDQFDFSIPDPDVDVGTPPDLPDIKEPDEVEEDEYVGPCVPSCSKKECGSDGCDGVCGYCAYGYLCDPGGTCTASVCPKQCTISVAGKLKYKECGPDACNGYCGFCLAEATECGPDGFCHAGDCKGSCTSKECGDDGCGHSCGNCKLGQMCSDKGKCVPHPCGTVTYKGQCKDKFNLVICQDLKLVETNCKTIQDTMCGWDKNAGKYDCIPEQVCEPKCKFENGTVKECGADGCWGSCGICPTGWGCAAGICMPAEGGECAWVDGIVGACVGDERWFCAEGILYQYDCMEKMGQTCGWDFTANLGAGGYDCMP